MSSQKIIVQVVGARREILEDSTVARDYACPRKVSFPCGGPLRQALAAGTSRGRELIQRKNRKCSLLSYGAALSLFFRS